MGLGKKKKGRKRSVRRGPPEGENGIPWVSSRNQHRRNRKGKRVSRGSSGAGTGVAYFCGWGGRRQKDQKKKNRTSRKGNLGKRQTVKQRGKRRSEKGKKKGGKRICRVVVLQREDGGRQRKKP